MPNIKKYQYIGHSGNYSDSYLQVQVYKGTVTKILSIVIFPKYLQHFIEGNGPTLQYPDPTPADSSTLRPARPVRKRSLSLSENQTVIKEDNCEVKSCI